MIARRQYPNIFLDDGNLDVPEVDNTIRNAWLSIYALQETAQKNKEFLDGAVQRGEIAADGTVGASEVVRQTIVQTVQFSPAAGVTMVSPQFRRLPFVNSPNPAPAP